MQAITGKSFYVAEGLVVVYEASARRLLCGDWQFRYTGMAIVKGDVSATEGIAELLDDTAMSGGFSKVEKVLISPVMTVLLYEEGTIIRRHFAAARQVSLGYFDLPDVDFGGYAKPVRVAQFPLSPTTLTDVRGYPAVW